MSRRCEISGKGVMTGNNVSHAHNKTRRRFLPNLQVVTLMSEELDKMFKLRVATSTIRTIEKNGGLDGFLLSAKDKNLTDNAIKIKKAIKKSKDS
ncbi:MAG: 50S ribosomal protein L28 [Alphaproteobacteria bacterium TMED87]|nr:50S ribosomal protein L28 [Rhodospirillaceae bacterium]OUV08716.1 MAG: 50S ribosomal protein L28 [Alphaproteobacteria bacterium TMED87]